ncbi:iron chelate uptake ABC transporter family permease subunit [Phytoactinopolyspora mesophila]|uniref:Iron chelate uptake ABC transporter family permease subunit n=1 Tax=Phytoactinopolyspora mesophila TaxID=2650750 RepID=A0A7K3M2G2_9ACTN|nr:iron chelate uptake ABC transporter family permease subunit [Phytoactinopolyspora mesophila]
MRWHLRGLVVLGGALVLLCGVVVLHVGQGSSGIGLGELGALLTGDADAGVRDIFVGSRLPRLLTGLVAGAALAASGALAQAVTRNPLAAPETLGVNAGGYLAVVVVAAFGINLGGFASAGLATLGGLIAAVGVWALAGRRGLVVGGRVLLAGAAITMALMSLATLMLVWFERSTQGLFFWGNGSIAAIDSTRAIQMGGAVLFICVLIAFLIRPLDVLSIGDEGARALGANVTVVKLAALGLAVLLAASAVTVAGPIAFVGVVSPVTIRMLGVHRHALLLPSAMIIGAALLLAADVVARSFLRSASAGELPAGVITAVVGAPVFILLARRIRFGNVDDQAAIGARRRLPFPVVAAAGVGLLIVTVLAGLKIGDVSVSWSEIGNWLRGMETSVVDRRFGRLAVAAVAGACLAVAGVAVQAVVHNPIAEPSIIGVTGGASVGAVASLMLAPHAPGWVLPLAALAGGIAATLLLLLAAGRWTGGSGGRRDGRTRRLSWPPAGLTLDPTRVVLVGIGVGALCTAIVAVLAMQAQLAVNRALTWLAGSTYGRGLDDLQWLIVPVAVGVVLVVVGRSLDLLAYGEDTPRALGLGLGRARLSVLMCGAVMAAGAASVVGTVGFVGLVAPHSARALVGPSHRRLIPVAALFGAVLVVAADVVGRTVLAPREIPVGLVVALVGAPYLAWLLRRSSRRGAS